ncbi:MAG: nucleotidyltransferase family protein [Anaerolineae bacterium]
MNDHRPGQGLLDRLTAEMVTWLDTPDVARVAGIVARWDGPTWRAAEMVARMQGIGPYLHYTLRRTPLYDALPGAFRGWLAAEYARNVERVAFLGDELAAILGAAASAGVPIMPLKGILVATRYHETLAIRPMADLDVLIRPGDLPALTAILQDLGYRHVPAATRHASTQEFLPHDASAMESRPAGYAGDPRPVDVHTHLRRYLWVDRAGYDVTEYLWAESRDGVLLGEPVRVPAPRRLLTYLALHATYDLIRDMARLLHLLDLGYAAPLAGELDEAYADWTYPALRLASRVLPARLAGVDLSALAARTHPRVRRWAERVPLDSRCGLNVDPTPPGERNRWQLRWQRWHPTAVRLALGYRGTPLLAAYARHLTTVLRHLNVAPA